MRRDVRMSAIYHIVAGNLLVDPPKYTDVFRDRQSIDFLCAGPLARVEDARHPINVPAVLSEGSIMSSYALSRMSVFTTRP
jgi:hypothetical protein